MRRTGVIVPVVLLVASLFGSSCASPTVRRSEQVTFTAPVGGEALPQPVTVAWTVDADLQARIDAGEVVFAVFVDRSPIAAGQNLLDLADDDCRRDTDCPDAQWLADRGVYATRNPVLLLEGLGDRRTSAAQDAADRHRALIVLLDAAGTRLGEDWWSTTFLIDRSH